jgi:hypothetical protein
MGHAAASPKAQMVCPSTCLVISMKMTVKYGVSRVSEGEQITPTPAHLEAYQSLAPEPFPRSFGSSCWTSTVKDECGSRLARLKRTRSRRELSTHCNTLHTPQVVRRTKTKESKKGVVNHCVSGPDSFRTTYLSIGGVIKFSCRGYRGQSRKLAKSLSCTTNPPKITCTVCTGLISMRKKIEPSIPRDLGVV